MKKTFIFYTDWIDYTEEMNREEKWLFLETILAFQNGEDLPSDIKSIKFIWSRVKKQLEEDNEKWSSELDKRKKAGKLWGLAKANKWKQVLASASKWKELLADNVNDNVNKNDNKETNIISKDITTEVVDNRNSDIDEIQEVIKQAIQNNWMIYRVWKQERNRIRNLVTGKDFWEICEKANMSRKVFIINIINLATKLKYGKPINNGVELFYNYASVYNLALKQKDILQPKKRRWIRKI